MKKQPDGKLLVSGVFQERLFDRPRYGLERLNPDGSRDASFDADNLTTHTPNCTDAQRQNNRRKGGGGAFRDSEPVVVRLNPNGTVGPSFNAAALGMTEVSRVLVQPDGKVLVAGDLPVWSATIARIIL